MVSSEQPMANSNNWPDNTLAITAGGLLNPEASTTGDGHYAKKLNSFKLTVEPDDQGVHIGPGSPSSTTNHFMQEENRIASQYAADGLKGTPSGFHVSNNDSEGTPGRTPKLNSTKRRGYGT